jgi:hypothetical protein
MPTGLPPSNALSKSVTIYSQYVSFKNSLTAVHLTSNFTFSCLYPWNFLNQILNRLLDTIICTRPFHTTYSLLLILINKGYNLRLCKNVIHSPVSSSQRPYRLWGPPNLLFGEYQELFPPGVKRPFTEADHSAPSSAEAKNDGAAPLYVFLA